MESSFFYDTQGCGFVFLTRRNYIGEFGMIERGKYNLKLDVGLKDLVISYMTWRKGRLDWKKLVFDRPLEKMNFDGMEEVNQ